ncbi:MAG: ATP-dependent zinc metalloprotease FtsH [Lachnospiraceae bacterium]|nr:ATP-dependent zinc metalloprotease FtsH [Lachnospiraceae bacterium]
MPGRPNNMIMPLALVLLVVFLIMPMLRSAFASDVQAYTLENYQEDLEAGRVTEVSITPNGGNETGYAVILLEDGTRHVLYATRIAEVEDMAREKGLRPGVSDIPSESSFMTSVLPMLLTLAVCMFFFYMMTSQGAGGSNARMMNFGKSKARLSKDTKVTLRDVAGLDEEKEDLEEVIDFLRDPGKYTRVGARIPKGVLLEGAPGTGKTLLAKAVAGEAGVPFYSISGSDFVEMFVGVGASRVRDMFEEAKKNAPCIVFIDEIDAVARRRGTGLGGSHDEREQTLNQLLVEMDGFGVNEGIIVMAATNRVDVLDPAILRPGRFDRKISVARPDMRGREAILKVHASGKPLSEDVDLREVARTTAGFTGADLENLLNEAAIGAARQNRPYVTQADIRDAFVKVGIGKEKRSHLISDKEKRITAFHETGHAILFHELPELGKVYTISVIPTGTGAGGYTMQIPENDEMYMTRGRMLQQIMASLGGRIAEELVLDDITTGASADIRQATGIARHMVMRYGMSENIGTINYEQETDDVFLGYDLGHENKRSEYIAGEIDKEVRRIIDDCYGKAREIILANKDILYRTAELLMEKEKLTGEEFDALFKERKPEPEPV